MSGKETVNCARSICARSIWSRLLQPLQPECTKDEEGLTRFQIWYGELASRVDEALGFVEASTLGLSHPVVKTTPFWASHTCLLLPYTIRAGQDSLGFHFGPVIRLLCAFPVDWRENSATERSARGIPERCLQSHRCQAKLRAHMPAFIRAVQREGIVVTWSSHPMHGNTIMSPGHGLKTRPFSDTGAELQAFFDVREEEGTHAGGMHLAMTGQNVTECIGGAKKLVFKGLDSRYHKAHIYNPIKSILLFFANSKRLTKQKNGLYVNMPA